MNPSLRGQMLINVATWTLLELNVLKIFVVFQRLAEQIEAPAFLEALYRVDRSFKALKEIQILRILKGLHQHLLMVLRVEFQDASTTAQGIPEFSLYNFYDGKSQGPTNI